MEFGWVGAACVFCVCNCKFQLYVSCCLYVSGQDGHISQFSLHWLSHNFDSLGTEVERTLWDGPHMSEQDLPTTTFDYHMNSEEGLKNTLKNIIKYGFCVVDGVRNLYIPCAFGGQLSTNHPPHPPPTTPSP